MVLSAAIPILRKAPRCGRSVVVAGVIRQAFQLGARHGAFVELYARAMRELVEGGEYQAILQRYLSPL